jgi:quinolinate synthase
MKMKHPEAEIMVHPECQPEVIDLADFVGSTSQMAEHVAKNESREFIVGTERGMLHALQKENPHKRFYSPGSRVICQDMKLTKLENVASALANMQYQIRIPDEVAIKAKKALNAMLRLGEKNRRIG